MELDAALVDSAADSTIKVCSFTIDMKNTENRRASYKLVAATGDDDDRVLVKLEARCAGLGQRVFYELPPNTLALANGWHLAGGKGPQAETPVNQVALKKSDEVKIHRAGDIHKPAEFVFSVRFDGSGQRQNQQRAAA